MPQCWSADLLEGSKAQPSFSSEAVEIALRRDNGAPRAREKAGEAGAERLDVGTAPIAARYQLVEHPLGWQPAHLD
jgi:hypothetical protein